MPPTPAPAAAGFPRRTLFAAAGVLALAAGCSSGGNERPAVTGRQADQLAGQVSAQEALVTAFAAAAAADPALGNEVSELAAQVRQQLDKLRAAAPSAAPTRRSRESTGASASASTGPTAPPPPGTRAWLRQQVTATADSHTGACLDQSGARAALLGSIAAGLRGMDTRLT